MTSTAFSERNAALVFEVAAEQAQGLVDKWVADQRGPADDGAEGAEGKGRKSRPIKTIDHDTMRLALNIIGYVGFGLKLLWPGQKLPEGTDPRLFKYSALEPADGHTMSFVDAVAGMLEMILLLLIVPEWILRTFSFPSHISPISFPFMSSLSSPENPPV